jgi:hypothetical protein
MLCCSKIAEAEAAMSVNEKNAVLCWNWSVVVCVHHDV